VPEVPRVIWYGRQDDPEVPPDPDRITFARPGEFCDTSFVAAVLCRRAFDGLEPLLKLRDELPMPALLLVPPGEVEAALERLREGDDLALPDTPPRLMAWRLDQLAARAAHLRDGLTRLGLKRGFMARLERALEQASDREPVSVLLIDVDHFKEINDRHGHLAGDGVLKELAQRLQASCPLDAYAARHAGDQLSVLVSAHEEEVISLAELVREAVRYRDFGDGITLTVSVGAATACAPVEPRELLREVDEAVYAAKAAGRDRVTHYSELAREAIKSDSDIDLYAFENITRVVAERVANVIARRGRRLFREIRQEADVDSLTGLYSRRYLDRRLAFELGEAQRGNRPLVVALIDIDFFGQVNKAHGWPAGDRVLADLAGLLGAGVRSNDWVARYGGEEFCLVMPGIPLTVAEGVLERVRQNVADYPFESDRGGELSLTVSIGAVERRADETAPEPLFQRVSEQLLRAKRGGRNRVRC
jgi:diguanylate cyclase (GGDEF)-like protein